MIPMRTHDALADLDDIGTFSVWKTSQHLLGLRRYSGLGLSVLTHSLALAALFDDPEAKAWALIHDCHEAITGDIPGPVLQWLRAHRPKSYQGISELQRDLDARFRRELGLEVSELTIAEVVYHDRLIRLPEERICFGTNEPYPEPWLLRAEADLRWYSERSAEQQIDEWETRLRNLTCK